MIEVGTGIVLRERANPTRTTTNDGYVRINSTFSVVTDSTLKNTTNRIMGVYKNSFKDAAWDLFADQPNTKGGAVARIPETKYDQSSAYSVTYIKLDKSPVVPITGTLAANEKAQISDLTAGVTEALERVSIVEQKKAERDATAWITPTLLNGWKLYSDTAYAFKGYNKDSVGVVRLSGLITGGALGVSAPVFYLPEGYRPAQNLRFIVPLSDGTMGTVDVNTAGRVAIVTGNTTSGISLTLSFLGA